MELDRNADFKFMEAKNLGVYTTKQWLKQQAPILRVLHDHDGDWQFHTDETEPQNDDIALVCLEDMIAADKSLNEIFNLDYGEGAKREFVGGEWTRFELDKKDDDEA